MPYWDSPSVRAEIDGELIGNCPVEFKIRNHGLRVFVPNGA